MLGGERWLREDGSSSSQGDARVTEVGTVAVRANIASPKIGMNSVFSRNPRNSQMLRNNYGAMITPKTDDMDLKNQEKSTQDDKKI
ncbi:hypothetical protein DITRI_Ditri03aG0120700 [Diplodiscus trichospermus]